MFEYIYIIFLFVVEDLISFNLVKEYYTNHYTVGSYFLSKFSVEAIVTFGQCFTQSVLNYYMINLQMGFITFTLLVYVLGMASTAVAVLMGAFVSDPGIAQELLPLLFVPQLVRIY